VSCDRSSFRGGSELPFSLPASKIPLAEGVEGRSKLATLDLMVPSLNTMVEILGHFMRRVPDLGKSQSTFLGITAIGQRSL